VFGKGGKGSGVRERKASQGMVFGTTTKVSLTHSLQEAEQVAYANVQVAAGQAATNISTQDVQHTTAATNVADGGAMDVDSDFAAQGTVGEGHGGTKRKAGEDAVPTAKKPRTGMFMTSLRALVTDTAIACRTCRCCFEEVNSVDTL